MTVNEIADAVATETDAAHNEILKRYGYDYYRGWLAGRTQAVEEIRTAQ